MSRKSFLKVTDQVVEHLRNGMLAGRWKGKLPGRDRLAAELGVSHTTMEAAMRRLSKEGLLVSDGAGRRRRIVLPGKKIVPRHYRVRIILYEKVDHNAPCIIELLDRLEKAGFSADLAVKSLQDLGMNVKRVARFVGQNPADAWVVLAGSRDVLEWFCGQPVPAYALFGSKSGLPIAGCGVRYEILPVIKRLAELGHHRIVLLVREEHVVPKPNFFSSRFLEALESVGIKTSSFNLPAWGSRPEGLHACLEQLFKVSPPTALIASEPPILLAVRDHLARCGIIAPRDVSLVSLDHDASFTWLDPLVTHFSWDHTPVTRRIVNWVKTVSRGKQDNSQITALSQFIEGGTIGPRPGFEKRS